MKGLILCAGKGTRLQPFSNETSKVLLPVANKPIIHYSIEKLLKQNIVEIAIVIQSAQQSLFSQSVGDGSRWGIQITYLYQDQPLGIANAVKRAEDFIGTDSFILLLGDNLIEQDLGSLVDAILRERHDGALLLGTVSKPQDYGIVEIANHRIIGLEEKPQQPKSNLAILGAYAFTPNIFDAIQAITPSKRGEYEITDAIQWLIKHNHSISYDITTQSHTDIGTIDRWLEGNRWMLLEANRLAEQEVTTTSNGVNCHHCTIIPPVVIDPSSQLTDCVIGPYVSIGPHVIMEHCRVENSILLDGIQLSQLDVKDAILSEQHEVVILRGADI